MAGFVNNIFLGFGLSLVLPVTIFIVLSIFLAITSGK